MGEGRDRDDLMSSRAALHSINLARLDLLSLRLALACTRVGSMTRAAALCNMSLSNASQRLTRLEGDLGVSLFFRRRNGLEPTDAGQAVADAALRIMEQVEQMIFAARCAPIPQGNVHENCGRAGRSRTSRQARLP